MFVHSKSGKCKLPSCSFRLCQFEHSEEKGNLIETVASEDSEHEDDEKYEGAVMDDTSSVGYGENDCHLCDMTFMCLEDLCEHFRSCHQEYYQQTQEGAAQYLVNENQC